MAADALRELGHLSRVPQWLIPLEQFQVAILERFDLGTESPQFLGRFRLRMFHRQLDQAVHGIKVGWIGVDFVWLIPLINLALFFVLGLALSIVVWCAGRQGRSFAARALCALTLLPAVWVALPRIYGAAGFLLAVGIASRLIPVLERRQACLQRLVRSSFPIVAAVAPILAVYLLGTDRFEGVARACAGPAAGWFPQHPPSTFCCWARSGGAAAS
jgi:hypothetical protein